MQQMQEFKNVHTKIKEKIESYEQNIKNTIPRELLVAFGDLRKIEFLSGSIDALMKNAYLNEIREKAESKNIVWLKVFEKFSETFPIEPEALRLMSIFKIENNFPTPTKRFYYPESMMVYTRIIS